MSLSLEEWHFKAGSEIMKLVERAENKGRKDMDSSSIPKAWRESSLGGSLVSPEKFLEAATYCQIASQIFLDEGNKSYAIYRRGLLLEEIGEYEKAKQAYLEVTEYNYLSLAQAGLSRCKAVEAGTYKPNDLYATAFSMMQENMPDMAGEMAKIMDQFSNEPPESKTN